MPGNARSRSGPTPLQGLQAMHESCMTHTMSAWVGTYTLLMWQSPRSDALAEPCQLCWWQHRRTPCSSALLP